MQLHVSDSLELGGCPAQQLASYMQLSPTHCKTAACIYHLKWRHSVIQARHACAEGDEIMSAAVQGMHAVKSASTSEGDRDSALC